MERTANTSSGNFPQKGDTMSFSVQAACPICREAVVETTDPGFHACQVEVPTCPGCRFESGITSATVRRTAFMALIGMAAKPETVLMHRDGLVAFG
jgi:hypothetical protein